MQLISLFIIELLSQHVSGIIMPIIRRIRPCPTACGVLPGCVGCGWQWSCGSAKILADPQDHCQPQPTHPGRTPHAVGHGLILLMMGIMMPETCWDRSSIINNEISCILLVLSLRLTRLVLFTSTISVFKFPRAATYVKIIGVFVWHRVANLCSSDSLSRFWCCVPFCVKME